MSIGVFKKFFNYTSVLAFWCCDKMHDISNLKKEGFTLAQLYRFQPMVNWLHCGPPTPQAQSTEN